MMMIYQYDLCSQDGVITWINRMMFVSGMVYIYVYTKDRFILHGNQHIKL